MIALFERLPKKKVLPVSLEPPKTSNNLRNLMSRVETRQWQKSMLEKIEGEILSLYAEICEYYHYMNCKECLVELHIGVERYLGTRGPWFLNYQMDDQCEEIDDPDPYPGCPKAEDYKIGCYGNSSQDTKRFIKDRLAWGIKFTNERFEVAFKLVPILENWPISKGIPEVSWIAGMIESFCENPRFWV